MQQLLPPHGQVGPAAHRGKWIAHPKRKVRLLLVEVGVGQKIRAKLGPPLAYRVARMPTPYLVDALHDPVDADDERLALFTNGTTDPPVTAIGLALISRVMCFTIFAAVFFLVGLTTTTDGRTDPGQTGPSSIDGDFADTLLRRNVCSGRLNEPLSFEVRQLGLQPGQPSLQSISLFGDVDHIFSIGGRGPEVKRVYT